METMNDRQAAELTIEEPDGRVTTVAVAVDTREVARLRARVAYEQRRRNKAEQRLAAESARLRASEALLAEALAKGEGR